MTVYLEKIFGRTKESENKQNKQTNKKRKVNKFIFNPTHFLNQAVECTVANPFFVTFYVIQAVHCCQSIFYLYWLFALLLPTQLI